MADSPAVALIVFNRPDLTRAAMERLSRTKPSRLLIIADGPRHDADARLCEQTLDTVRCGADWGPDIDWCVSDTNLGCSERVLTGLDWVFDRVERALVLEDDIEVSPDFFEFSAHELSRWADDPHVGSISARNELVIYPPQGGQLHTRRSGIWGWATWADRWRAFRRGFEAEFAGLARRLPHDDAPLLARLHEHFWHRREWTTSGVWDIAWTLWLVTHDMRTVVPAVNMSANHGFRPDGTHTAVDHDLRGEFPLPPITVGLTTRRSEADVAYYDDIATLLDLMMLYNEPRRWRMIADHTPADRTEPAMSLMLEPWRRRDDARAALRALADHVSSPHLTGLQQAFA